ncbi:glycosyltransferase family 8 protein [Acidocella aromatica]|uniref:Lipopolysaccharide biosynthesis glycosyltransferase n=1 Tax=Acidocella aromatica TaxID=1303579 RepID=A0A840VDW3_9PROT|nr:glycosyltransferase [Acidocella aromatica]MBB5374048.1 lipopolysaccharide biosynthesis glycosyltransferase [Acidocella aromatica]
MRASCCICYTTDSGYLLPTLVSAIQARRYSSREKADVAIYCLNAPVGVETVFAKVSAAEGINFNAIRSEDIDGANAMLARLFLAHLLPKDYRHFLYIDGDTQITDSLDPLLDYPVPPRRFLAASDPMTFAAPGSDRHGREIAAYFSALGISRQQQTLYFNTGVLRVNRDGWDEIGMNAWRLFNTHQEHLRFPDQDALNLAGMALRIPMSLCWNFPIFMHNAGVRKRIAPRIKHFMGAPKPWHGNFPPWDASTHQPYLDVIMKYPELSFYLPRMSTARKLRYVAQQHYKRGLETLTWAWDERRNRILDYEKDLSNSTNWPHLVATALPV